MTYTPLSALLFHMSIVCLRVTAYSVFQQFIVFDRGARAVELYFGLCRVSLLFKDEHTEKGDCGREEAVDSDSTGRPPPDRKN